ncbi:MAG: hypothetical protein ACI9JY_001997, partial [Saprospiraceae bacterium]
FLRDKSGLYKPLLSLKLPLFCYQNNCGNLIFLLPSNSYQEPKKLR